MRFIYIQIFLLLISTVIIPQELVYQTSIGEFESTSAFTITPTGFLFVTDISKNEVIKLDTLGMEVQNIGGYGWETSTFDEPVDVFATDLRVYITDKNNNRIQVFDKDLNYLFLLKTDTHLEEQKNFFYPSSCVNSIQGDIFILDSDNARVMKYNSEGNFLIEFGGYDSGNFILEDPIKLGIAHDSKIFVLEQNKITVFDQFGMGLFRLNLKSTAVNLNVTFDKLLITGENEVYFLNLRKPENRVINFTPNDIPENEVIIEALIYNAKLYVLTEENILVYAIINS